MEFKYKAIKFLNKALKIFINELGENNPNVKTTRDTLVEFSKKI